jgi:hypothetical protein
MSLAYAVESSGAATYKNPEKKSSVLQNQTTRKGLLFRKLFLVAWPWVAMNAALL